MRLPGIHGLSLVALLLPAACATGDLGLATDRCVLPVIAHSSASASIANVLSAAVAAEVVGADSVAVRFGRLASNPDSLSPAVPSVATATIPVLGLLPETDYQVEVIAFNSCGVSTGVRHVLRTGELPEDLPRYEAGGANPSPGYVAFAAGNYGLVIDNTGRVVWYHRFPSGPGLNFQAQPNGRYVARPPAPAGTLGVWVEVDALGNVGRTLGCVGGLSARLHDLLALSDGSYWVMCDEVRVLDLSSQGRSAQQPVLGTVVQHVSEAGELLFEWSPFDHLTVDIGDLYEVDLLGSTTNWTHGNALDVDRDGNLLLSLRNTSEVLKIDTRTGRVIWRMGGSRNDFTFEGVTGPPFARQHAVRYLGPGRLVLLDNLGEGATSRAEVYEYDEATGTARLIAARPATTAVTAELGGSTQPLPGGALLVSFGSGGSVEEYGGDGGLQWKINGYPGYVFRAQRIRSLYHPGLGDPR